MRANLTFFFSKIAPIFSRTAPPKDQNGSVVFYFGPSRELKWPYTRRAESPLRGQRLIGAVLTTKKDLFCGQRFGPNFGVVSALLNLQCKQAIVFFLQNTNFSAKHKLHLLDHSVQEIDFFIMGHFMVKSVLYCFNPQ